MSESIFILYLPFGAIWRFIFATMEPSRLHKQYPVHTFYFFTPVPIHVDDRSLLLTLIEFFFLSFCF